MKNNKNTKNNAAASGSTKSSESEQGTSRNSFFHPVKWFMILLVFVFLVLEIAVLVEVAMLTYDAQKPLSGSSPSFSNDQVLSANSKARIALLITAPVAIMWIAWVIIVPATTHYSIFLFLLTPLFLIVTLGLQFGFLVSLMKALKTYGNETPGTELSINAAHLASSKISELLIAAIVGTALSLLIFGFCLWGGKVKDDPMLL